MKKWIVFALCIATVAGSLCGCINMDAVLGRPREFTCEEMTMMVPANMLHIDEEAQDLGWTFIMDSALFYIAGCREPFDQHGWREDYMTAEELAYYIAAGFSADATVDTGGDFPIVSFTDTVDGTMAACLMGFYKSSQAYWYILVSCRLEELEGLRPRMMECLESVVFE